MNQIAPVDADWQLNPIFVRWERKYSTQGWSKRERVSRIEFVQAMRVFTGNNKARWWTFG